MKTNNLEQDKLEQFILNNRAAFDELEPDPEIWNRIADAEKKPPARIIHWGKIAWRAAAAITIFIISYFIHDIIDKRDKEIKDQNISKAEVITENPEIRELIEAEGYYSSLILNKKNELQPYLEKDPELKKDLENELSDLDEIYQEFKKDLNDNAANEEVIMAMIQSYRTKLEILEDILHQISNYDKNNKKTVQQIKKI